MSDRDSVRRLANQIENSRKVLRRIEMFYQDFVRSQDLARREVPQAIVISDLLVNYYTCLETIFLRISQFFENKLKKDKWHQDLLDTMRIEVTDQRQAVIGDQAYQALVELLKFRHFKRYYFEFEYDWDKLEFLQKKLLQASVSVNADLDRFAAFLRKLL